MLAQSEEIPLSREAKHPSHDRGVPSEKESFVEKQVLPRAPVAA